MAGSLYIQSAGYAQYGLPATTTATQVYTASGLLDAYLRRPEGVEIGLDAAGAPAYMTAPNPGFTYKIAAPISAGQNVVATFAASGAGSSPPLNPNMLGDVLLLDRANNATRETCIISAVAWPQVTLTNVQFDHAANCTVEQGLAIFEQVPLPAARMLGRISRPGNPWLLSGMGIYAYGRRSDQVSGRFGNWALLTLVGPNFGGPPVWVPWPVSQAGVDPSTLDVWISWGFWPTPFSDVRIWYIAGWTYATIPEPIKWATAQLVTAAVQDGPASQNIRRWSADQISLERWTQSNLSPDIVRQLQQYRARVLA